MVAMIKIENLAEIQGEFVARAHSAIWCNVATVDAHGRPRSRILHPMWDGATGWITTRRHSPKAKHLAGTPFVSVAYIKDLAKPAYADCHAVWENDPAERKRVWELIGGTPEPLGFDPAPLYISYDHPEFGLLKLTPWRIEVPTLPTERRVWQES
ncbi:MAG TPA: pyridoxamine 5'-phosphate oxidase family protein [Aggregatilineales bacterium]|nr:pyridoxamine 5'-phosphate oxidase family protein [Aggregatilineales bacterium]